jgi:hypothetical protein
MFEPLLDFASSKAVRWSLTRAFRDNQRRSTVQCIKRRQTRFGVKASAETVEFLRSILKLGQDTLLNSFNQSLSHHDEAERVEDN